MKRILGLLSAAAILVAFTSCGSTPETPKAEETVKEAPVTVTEETNETVPETGAELLIDDMEEGMFWEAVGTSWNDGDVSIACDLSTDWGTDGSTSLKCTIGTNGGEWEKGGFFTQPYEVDWTGMTMLTLDVYNPNEYEIKVCPVLQCGENWEDWNQFTEQPVPAGESASLTFEIPHKKYLNYVQRVIIYSWGAYPEGTSFYVDNIFAKN